jgi:hypothetical protein
MKQLLLLFFSIAAFSQKTTEPFDSNALGESREITIACFFRKKSHKKYPSYFTGRGLLVQSVLEHYLMAPIGMIYLK